MVLTCPIAYIGEDGRIHLTDPNGKADLAYNLPESFLIIHYPVVWSPSGRRIGFSLMKWKGLGVPTNEYPAILDPMSGRITIHDSSPGEFRQWLDEGRYLDECFARPGIRNADTGQLIVKSKWPFDSPVHWISAPLAPHVDGRHVVFIHRGIGAYLRRDMTLGRTIWSCGTLGPYGPMEVDPAGEWVAWSVFPHGTPGGWVMLKRLDGPSTEEPIRLGTALPGITFCDWTEAGELLVLVSEDGAQRLAIMDLSGNIVRRLPITVPPWYGPAASWRKYGHQ
jgi:hypothetical protein